ncbi:MAG TPA: MFS transporter [Kofleriaceae bacterium]
MPNQPWWKEPTKAQWSAFIAAWSGWVLDAFDFTIYLLVAKHIASEFHVSRLAVAGSITLTLLVRMLGGAVAGWMADRWGRKLPLMLSLVWFAVFDAAIFFAPSFAWVIVLRTIFGFGMGAEWTAGTALAMESWPARTRKLASGLLQAGWPIGFLLAAVVATFVVPLGWRYMFLIAAVPALLVLPIRFMVPDELGGPPATRKASAGFRAAVAELTAPGILRMIVLGTAVTALGFVVYYGLTANYALALITEHGMTEQSAYLSIIIFNLGMLVGVIAAGSFANRFGVIAALVAPALLMIPFLPLFVGAVPALLPVGAFLGGALGVGYSGVTPVLTTSLFPAHVRARAIGVVYHLGALIAAFVPAATVELADKTSLTLSSSIGVVSGAGLLAMALAVLATRRYLAPAESLDSPDSSAAPADAAAA